jgi:hypothetical protein
MRFASCFLVAAIGGSPALAAGASMETAIVIGANHAPPGQLPLRYSHGDATSLAAVLREVGAFAPEDVHVMLDPSPDGVLAILDEQTTLLRGAGGESLLVFYYSGHADDEAIYPNGQPLSLEAIRSRLDRDIATIRIGIVDACRGGAWTRAKGLVPTQEFQVHLPFELVSEGSALLASSSGSESAHESEALQGSFFTHYLVAGLRGAASPSMDGEVTLGQAFAYANRMTVRDTALTSQVPQHPSFDIHLRGRQDLVLTRAASSPSVVTLSEQAGPLQVVELASGVPVVEIPSGERMVRVALPPGSYLVRKMSGDRVAAAEIEVRSGQTVTVAEDSLQVVGTPSLFEKSASSPVDEPRDGLGVRLGLQSMFGAFYTGLAFEADGLYRFTERFGAQVRAGYYLLFPTSLTQQLLNDFGVQPTNFSVMRAYGLAEGRVMALQARQPQWALQLSVALGGGIALADSPGGRVSIGTTGQGSEVKPALSGVVSAELHHGSGMGVGLSVGGVALMGNPWEVVPVAGLAFTYDP